MGRATTPYAMPASYEEDGKYYLITIMTNLADGETSRAEVSGLAAALWDQRSTLAPEQGYKQV